VKQSAISQNSQQVLGTEQSWKQKVQPPPLTWMSFNEKKIIQALSHPISSFCHAQP